MNGDWNPSEALLRSPKQGPFGGHVAGRWYPYYAGFTEEFVDDVLRALELEPTARVLDPWNGSGTTTIRAAKAGHPAVGFDANPVLVLVARGRLLPANVLSSAAPLTQEIVEQAKGLVAVIADDPLGLWMDGETAESLRSLEAAIQHLLIERDRYEIMADRGLTSVSSLAAFFYVALFATVRGLLDKFGGSNPTWLRHPKGEDTLVSGSFAEVQESFVGHAQRLIDHLMESAVDEDTRDLATVGIGNSVQLRLDRKADAILSSPPYCTRIDYVIATAPELAVMGFDSVRRRELRAKMIGTPTMADTGQQSPPLGPKTSEIVAAIQNHPSKASGTYYYRYFKQYFEGMAKSLRSLASASNRSARMALVLQDSFYKDLHIDLPLLITDMALGSGWRRVGAIDFNVKNTMAAVNPGSRRYRKTFGATETVVFFERTNT